MAITPTEFPIGTSLVLSGEALIVLSSIKVQDFAMAFVKERHVFLDDYLVSSFGPCLFCGIVGMGTRAVPISLDGFWLVVDVNSKVFSQSTQNITGEPDMVTTLDVLSDSDLVLPLSARHL